MIAGEMLVAGLQHATPPLPQQLRVRQDVTEIVVAQTLVEEEAEVKQLVV